ncbi:MAG: MFS transporter [candidate division KSB1 bacterium]|nr:MFS transporter [candidate division KSB1 bacterium]
MLDAQLTRSGLKISIIEGCWATVHMVVTTGAYLVGYALFLGANDLELGILTALPLLAQAFQIGGAYYVEKTGQRKRVAMWTSLLGRTMWLPIALIPLFHPGRPVALFMIFAAVSGVLMNLSGPAWVAWMSDLVPPRIRGRYFGRRNSVVALVTVVTSLTVGSILDLARNRGSVQYGFLTIQGLAVIAGWLAFVSLRKQPEPPYSKENPPSLRQYLVRPFQDRTYRKVITFYLYWLFVVGIASPFFSAHLIKHLGWNFKSIASLDIIAAALAVIFQPLWGKALDRYGHKPVLYLTAAVLVHVPLYYAFCPYTWRWPIYANAVFSGIFWSGFNTAIFNLVLHSSPRRGRPGFVALQAALSGVMNFLASTFGGWVAELLAHYEWQLGPVHVVNYQVLFAATALLRLPSLWLIGRLEEPEAKRTSELIRQAFVEMNRRLGFGRQFFALASEGRQHPRTLLWAGQRRTDQSVSRSHA